MATRDLHYRGAFVHLEVLLAGGGGSYWTYQIDGGPVCCGPDRPTTAVEFFMLGEAEDAAKAEIDNQVG